MKTLVSSDFLVVPHKPFRRHSHNTISCNRFEIKTPDTQKNMRDHTHNSWNLAHIPRTHLGARRFANKRAEQTKVLSHMWDLMNAPIVAKSAIFVIFTRILKQPWQFDHGQTKASCLWSKNLPKSKSINMVIGVEHRALPFLDVWKMQSRHLGCTAKAKAKQWGTDAPVREAILTIKHIARFWQFNGYMRWSCA